MLELCTQEEQNYLFDTFNATIAYELGTYLSKKAIELKLPIIVDISTPKQTLYHFAAFGSTTNNENFIRRKRNTVMLFCHSTRWVDAKVKSDVPAMHTKYGTNDADFSILQGGFPILVKDMGFVGSFCVSGLTEKEDHGLIIEALDNYFHRT